MVIIIIVIRLIKVEHFKNITKYLMISTSLTGPGKLFHSLLAASLIRFDNMLIVCELVLGKIALHTLHCGYLVPSKVNNTHIAAFSLLYNVR